MIEKKKPISFNSPGLDNRSWKQVLNWRWGMFFLIAIITLVFFIYRQGIDQRVNLRGIDFFYIIFTYIFIFPALGIISHNLLETRSERPRTVHLYNLQFELSRKLMVVNDWDDLASVLVQFITEQFPLTGLSLLVYNPILEKYEIVAEKLLGMEIEPFVHCLPLIHDEKPIALLKLYMSPDDSYPPTKLEWIQNLAPEVAMAVERIDLFQSLTESKRAIQKSEHHRIARHLHDTIAHDLAYLCMKLDQLSSSSGHINGSVKFHSEIESMYSIANNAVDQMRNLLDELQDENHAIPHSDLVSNVKECASLIGARANFQVNIMVSGDPRILTPQMHRQVLYLLREILRNVEKHAHAQHVTLSIDWLEDGLAIKISDDGKGFDGTMWQKFEGHYGLKTLRDIVNELNGSLSVFSGPGEGTQITIYLPG